MGWVKGGISVIYAIIPGICLFVKISRYRRVCVHVLARACVCVRTYMYFLLSTTESTKNVTPITMSTTHAQILVSKSYSPIKRTGGPLRNS